MLLEGTGKCSIEVEGESYAFDEIRELAEQEGATPGKAFTVELDLRESLGGITVEHQHTEFGTLEISDTLKTLWAGIIEDSFFMEVTARIWTCPDWEDDFYASVRVDLPPIESAIEQIEADRTERKIAKYGTATPSADQLLAESKNPEIANPARENLGLPPLVPEANAAPANPYRSAPVPQPVESPSASQDWSILLMPDNTPRANLFQRGYARAAYGRAMGDVKAPRIDYATVGQCKHIAAAYGGDVQEIDKRGGLLLKLMWWVLLVMLGIVALIGVFTPPVGWVVTGLVAWPFVHHYVTRRKLEPPFGPQR